MNENINIPLLPYDLDRRQLQAATGALVGAAVGDALGARFEFEEADLYAATFPKPVLGGTGEMLGGGHFGWAPGEFTDDTQMAMALAESLIHCNGFDPKITFDYFRAWTNGARDIGSTTAAALSGKDYRTAAKDAHEMRGASGGNGCVMRIAPIALAGVIRGADWTREVAYAQAELTHYDPVACWGAVLVAEYLRRLIITSDPEAAFENLTAILPDEFGPLYEMVLNDPNGPMPGNNGTALVCIAHAFWAYRRASSYQEAVETAINIGGDTDTVAAVTGALAGARWGIQGIPSRWTTYLNGTVNLPTGKTASYDYGSVQDIARQLVGLDPKPETEPEPPIRPKEVHDLGVWASNLIGAAESDTDFAVVSLCRTYGRFKDHQVRREVFMIDTHGANASLEAALWDAVDAVDAFLANGKKVLVHCHGGRSRTGLVLKAWYMRKFGASHAEAHEWLESVWRHYATWNYDFTEVLDSYEWSRQVDQ